MILGLIPARGGSKGVPRKNVRMIAGKPLIAWTIEAAKQATLLDRVVVSTEDAEIAEVAREWGAEVLDRPDDLATDGATSLSVWQHALSEIRAEILVNLYPTSPIRDDSLIDGVVESFLRNRPTCLATGFVCRFVPFGDGDDGSSDLHGREDVEGFFYDDGNVYVVEAATVHAGLQYGTRLEHYHNTREGNVEIDEEFDFWLAEQVLLRRMAEQR